MRARRSSKANDALLASIERGEASDRTEVFALTEENCPTNVACWHEAELREPPINVRYWHKADIDEMPINVRFRG
jgi:hypothetical protein